MPFWLKKLIIFTHGTSQQKKDKKEIINVKPSGRPRGQGGHWPLFYLLFSFLSLTFFFSSLVGIIVNEQINLSSFSFLWIREIQVQKLANVNYTISQTCLFLNKNNAQDKSPNFFSYCPGKFARRLHYIIKTILKFKEIQYILVLGVGGGNF